MVPVGVFAGDRRDHHKHSWAGLLGKMHSFPILEEDWNLPTCLHRVFPLCIPKQITKINKLVKP